MTVQLNPKGPPVRVGAVKLYTPGLAGTVEAILPPTKVGRLRSAPPPDFTAELENALASQNVEWERQLIISGAKEAKEAPAGITLRSTMESAIRAEVPGPSPGFGQFVLASDEAGVQFWSFSQPAAGADQNREYLLPRHVPELPAPEVAKARGLTKTIGDKLIQILVFPLVEPLLGKVGVHYAAAWEHKNRPYGIRTVTPENYREKAAPLLTAEDWTRLAQGRALLLVHGTFSRTYAAFGGLSRDTVAELCRRYQNRVFAFDHYTMSEDPRQNLNYFLAQMPEGISLEIDIVCHSRGGLVSRLLAERQAELPLGQRKIRVQRVVQVAVPNAGTVLTRGEYMGEFISSYTNLLNFFPDNGITETLEAVVTVAKMVAVGAMDGLKGLQSMRPEGEFLRQLNADEKSATTYFALAANFEPKEPGLKEWAADHLLDKIFQKQENDMVVPTRGVAEVAGSDKFPIAPSIVFPGEKGVKHTRFFEEADTQKLLLEWLPGT